MIHDWAPEHVVTEVRAADVAARAARAVPGVVRLQPGVLGLLGQLAAEAWGQATGEVLPDIGGVQAELAGGGVRLDLRLVVDGGYRVADVGVAVQRAVASAVAAAVGRPVAAVAVHVVEIDLAADR